MFELTPDQQAAIEVLNSEDPFVVVKGYAGTGKTTTVVEWLKNHRTAPGSVLFTAPTNKATGVLREMCKEQEVGAECKTIHSSLGLQMRWKEGEQVLVPNSRLKGLPEFHSFDIVVIDECSMLDRELLSYIEDAQASAGNRVIYMGDPAQLPPVGDKVELSDSFNVDTSTELQKIMRQSGDSNIPALGLMLRNFLSQRNRPVRLKDLAKFVDNDTVFMQTKQDGWAAMLEDFDTTEEDVRYLAFKNDSVKAAIVDIRQRLYGKNAPELMPGEKVQALKPILNPIDGSPDYSTDSLVTLENVREDVYEGIPVWKIQINGAWYTTVKGEFETRYRQVEGDLRKACSAKKKNWNEFYRFVNAFCWVRPAQGMTVHKSQGSTFDRVYVNASDILSVRWDTDLCKKLMYVACSRPRSQLVLLV